MTTKVKKVLMGSGATKEGGLEVYDYSESQPGIQHPITSYLQSG